MTDGDGQDRRRDMSARAAWLSFVRGRTQDEIAAELAVSRQAAQRLVALAVKEGFIKFRLDHPLARCLQLRDALVDRFALDACDVSPSDTSSPGTLEGVAQAGADRLMRYLTPREPVVICVGTGRTLRAAVEQVEPMRRPEHQIASLVGAMSTSGAASPYDVVMRLADLLGARRYPLPCPVIAESETERAALQSQRAFTSIAALRDRAAASFVGIGEVGQDAPICTDGFVTASEMAVLAGAGAIGEITGWFFDRRGAVVDVALHGRVASLPLETPPRRPTVLIGCGPRKTTALRAALVGGLATELVTDETTAANLLADNEPYAFRKHL